jgi:hypothetical protein
MPVPGQGGTRPPAGGHPEDMQRLAEALAQIPPEDRHCLDPFIDQAIADVNVEVTAEAVLRAWSEFQRARNEASHGFKQPGRSTMGRSPESVPKTKLATVLGRVRAQGWEPGRVTGWTAEQVEHSYGALCKSGTTMKNLPLACVSVELLAAHQPDTVRGNMYLVVSAGWLPDTSKKSYDRIQRLLNRLREVGAVPWSWVVDTVRSTIKPSSWSGLADFADTVREAYRLDFWSRLPEYVEVIVEKDTVAGKLAEVTREYDVPLHPIRGYNSQTFCRRIAAGWDEITKPITVYYMGDHDPSGRDLERDVRERLTRYSKKDFTWKRLAISPEQFEEYAIRPLAPKKSDKRYRWFVGRGWHDCAEVEAVPATELRAILRGAIESHIPAGEWARLRQIEELEKQQWEGVMASFHPAGREEPLPEE